MSWIRNVGWLWLGWSACLLAAAMRADAVEPQRPAAPGAPGKPSAPPRPAEPVAPAATLARLAEAFRADSGAAVGAHVLRLADGAEIFDFNAARPLIPASNQKVLTSAVALKRLGRDFRFRTSLVLEGKDLVVYGDGDPTSGDSRLAAERKQTIYAAFDRWAEAVRAAGVAKFDNLVLRAGIFAPPHVHPDWPDNQENRWYSAPVGGLNFNDNCVDVGFEVRGGQLLLNVSPESRYIAVDNRLRLGPKHLWNCRLDRQGTSVTLTGTVSRSSAEPLSVAAPNPPAMFGCVLADRLHRAGMLLGGQILLSLDGRDAEGVPAGANVLAVDTTPLADALTRSNKQSLNMMAECLFLRSAVEGGQPGSWKSAAQIANAVLARDYGLPAGQFNAADGSGYSRANRISPAGMTKLLRAMAGEPMFVESLAVSGDDGSLTRRMKDATGRGRVLAKTGSLAGVSALSGYVTDRAGKPAYAFSVIVNGATYGKKTSARGLQDALAETLVKYLDAQPGQAVGAGR